MKYPKVFELGHVALGRLFDGEVVVEEKVDGSQFRIAVREDAIHIGSKNVDDIALIHWDGEVERLRLPEQFELGVESVAELVRGNKAFWLGLNKELTIFAEYLKEPRHNTLVYRRVPRNHIMVFDMAVGKEFLFPSTAKELAKSLGFEFANILYEGEAKPQDLKPYLKARPLLGGEKIEGIVVKNYHQTYDPKYSWWVGAPLVGKWVNSEFREVNDKNWKQMKKAETIDWVVSRYLTEARLAKSVQHLRDEGRLENTMSDLKYLLPEFAKDILEEEGEAIKEILFKMFKKKLSHKANSFVATTYKRWLENSLFGYGDEK